jgi:hypothetical protein
MIKVPKNGAVGASFKGIEEVGRKTSPMTLREKPAARPGATTYQRPTAKRSKGRSAGR